MLVSKKNEVFAIAQKPISMDSAHELIGQYIAYYQWAPEIIRMHPNVHDELASTVPATNYSPHYDTFMGMKIEIDPTLKEDEWRIGKSSEIVTEMA